MVTPGPSTTPPTGVSEPGPLTQLGVQAGLMKVELEHLQWLDRVTQDRAWLQRASWLRVVPMLAAYCIVGLITESWGFLLGALIAVIGLQMAFGDWIRRRAATSIRNLHGIGDKRSFWADWPAGLYLAVNLALVVMVLGLGVLVLRAVDDGTDDLDVFVGPVACRAADDGNRFVEVAVGNSRDEVVAVIVTFSDVASGGDGAVEVEAPATLGPTVGQTVEAVMPAIGTSEGCAGITATVRRAP